MGEVFFISDTHFNHKNIIKLADRPFDTVESMNNYMIEQWNEVVGAEDMVFFLGDFALGRQVKENAATILSLLNGNKVLVRGNHDRLSRQSYLNMGFSVVHNLLIYLIKDTRKFLVLTHKPLSELDFSLNPDLKHIYTGPNAISIYGHTHKIGDPHCVCVENINYRPISLPQLKNKLGIL